MITDSKLALRRYERLLRSNHQVLRFSVAFECARDEGGRAELSELAKAMARRGLRIASQKGWCVGTPISLDTLGDPDKILGMNAPDFRFVALPDGRPTPVYCGMQCGPISSAGPEVRRPQAGCSKERAQRFQHEQLARTKVRTLFRRLTAGGEFDVIWLGHEPQDGKAERGEALLIRWFEHELPEAADLPEGADNVDEQVREDFVHGRDCRYVAPREWGL